jgi:hypothetical protein
MEVWKDIKNYEGLYQVSNKGNIYSIRKNKLFKLNTNKFGYYCVSLYKNSTTKTYYVHRLVAETFIPNPDNKPEIDHIDTIKTNNRVENLRWCNHKENMNNTTSHKHYNKRAVKCTTTNKVFNSSKEASRYYNIADSNIIRACRNPDKYCGISDNGEPLYWEYVL